MAGKHIIAIHGRATKPDEETKNRLVIRALQTGIARVDPKLAQAFPGRDIKFTLVYYGDINNKIMVEASPKHKENMVQRKSEEWIAGILPTYHYAGHCRWHCQMTPGNKRLKRFETRGPMLSVYRK